MSKTKTPICEKCGKVLKGRVPIDAEHITCFFCANPDYKPGDEDKKLTNWKNKRD